MTLNNKPETISSPARCESDGLVIVDDQSLSRAGLLSLLGRKCDLSIVDQVDDPMEVACRIIELRPCVTVINVLLGHARVLTLARAILEKKGATSVLLINVPPSIYLLEVFAALGVRGLVLESDPPALIAEAVQFLSNDISYMSRSVASLLLESMSRKGKGPSLHSLTARELEVLRHIVQGASNKIISFELNLSTKTVEGHRSRITRKLGFKSTAEVVSFALQQGFLPAA